MRMYLILKERAAAFRADPEVHEALTAAARVAERSQPTLNDCETYIDLLADPSAYKDFDATPTSTARLRLCRAAAADTGAPDGARA